MRSINLANALVDTGHNVTLWSSAFYHQEKRHRTREFQKIRISDSLEIRLIPSRGYSGNIGPGRLIDHAVLAMNLKNALVNEKATPDVAFVGYPPIEFAYVAVKWLKARSVPTILDAKDQWPQIFIESFPKLIQPLARLAFAPYFYLGRTTMREATAFCTMAQGFLDWMGRFADRALSPTDCVVPLSPIQQKLSDESIAEATHWWKGRGVVNDGRKRFFFVGSLSQAFDFGPLIDAARRASRAGEDWQFVLCGDGAKADHISDAFAGLPNVVLPGWVDRPKVVALANMSIVGLAPYRNTDDFVISIPNKVIDYLSLGKPIVSPLKGEVEALIKCYDTGVTYDLGDDNQLFDVLREVCDDDARLAAMSRNAIVAYNIHFSGEKVYQGLVEKLVALSRTKGTAC